MNEEKLALLAQYVKHLKEEFNYVKDIYPDDVQEAYKIIIQVWDIIADPSNEKQSLQEALFEKVPQEKIKWAIEVTKNWKTEEEQRAEAREKERKKQFSVKIVLTI